MLTQEPLAALVPPDQDVALGHSPGSDISLDSGGYLATHMSPFLSTHISPYPLSPQPTNRSASPSLTSPHPGLSHHNGARALG